MNVPPESVAVKLFAGLERRTPQRRSQYLLPLAQAPTVGAVAACLGLTPGAAGIVLVNGVHARDDHVLRPGDEVSMFPPVGGG
jgi:molybdopterin converting factor small subunit